MIHIADIVMLHYLLNTLNTYEYPIACFVFTPGPNGLSRHVARGQQPATAPVTWIGPRPYVAQRKRQNISSSAHCHAQLTDAFPKSPSG